MKKIILILAFLTIGFNLNAQVVKLGADVIGGVGADGQDGTNGVDGATWLSGSGGPDSSDGKVGDFWFDTDPPNTVFEKMTSTLWQVRADLKGDDGAAGTTDHTALSNIGTNTHAQIDSHIADTSIHFQEDGGLLFRSVVTNGYTLALTDVNKIVTKNGSGDITVNVDVDANVDFEIGTVIFFESIGDGELIVNFMAGVTGTNAQTYPHDKSFSIIKLGADYWAAIDPPQDLKFKGELGSGLNIITSNPNGTFYNMASANSSETYVAGSPNSLAPGGYAKIKINTVNEPVVSGADEIEGATWVTGTDMYLVLVDNGSAIEYFYLRI